MTTDRPYTDDDLRAEAARQHHTATTDPDFMGIGEQMEDSIVASTEDGDTGLTWHELLVPEGGGSYEAYGEAQNAINDLLSKAADVSEWAINLGADGLEPDGHTFQLGAQGTGSDDPEMPFVRMHFAFHPEATDAERDRFVMQLTKIIAANL